MQESNPIIIVKKKSGHGGHHGGAWKVAYADFVTAMMALFIVLWLLSSDDKVKKAVGGYFQDPLGNGKMMGTNMAGSGDALSVSRDDLKDLQKKIEQAMSEAPNLQKIRSQVQITITGEGLRIELLESEGGYFFDLGSAKPSDAAIDLLSLLAQELGKLPNPLLIEGHTDAKPYHSQNGYSNWELSADRANMARRIMQEKGVREDQVKQVRGFADQSLRKRDDPMHVSNRRVSVIVQYLDAAKRPPEPAQSAKAEPRKTSSSGHHP